MVAVQKILKAYDTGTSNQHTSSQMLNSRADSRGDKGKKENKKTFAETLREKMG